MSSKVKMSDQEQMAYVFMAVCLLILVFSLGPVVFCIAALTIVLLSLSGVGVLWALGLGVVSVLAGMLMYQDFFTWIMSPINTTHYFYSLMMPEGLIALLFDSTAFNAFGDALVKQFWEWLIDIRLWIGYCPAGMFMGMLSYVAFKQFFNDPLASIKRQKPINTKQGKVGGTAISLINLRKANVVDGSIIGVDKYAKAIELSDKCANQHTLVLGTTGSGKTVTVCNVVESAINRGLAVIYIDGKGDYDLAKRVGHYAKQKGRPSYIFSMSGKSIAYNPLSSGGFTSKKDRIIELREWSEEHYKKLAEGYLQTVFKVMEHCNIPCNLTSLSEHLDLKLLKELVRKNAEQIPNSEKLMKELQNQDKASKSVESLVAEIRNFTASEIGHLFEIQEGEPVLTLERVIAQKGIAYFCLPSLEFPSMSQTLGRLVINDLKATMAQQLSKGRKDTVYVVFDEFSVFAGEQVLNVINMGRSAGINAVLSTQSLSDIASGRKENADHFINQVVGNCNNFILHRQNSAEDAEKLAAILGTRHTLEYTAQVSEDGPTQMGTVRRTRGFIAHPDEIKSLKTGEAFFYSKENSKVHKMKARMSKI